MSDPENSNKPGTEGRRFPRLSTDIDVVYSSIGKTAPETANHVKDISEGGICLITYEDVPIGTVLTLKMVLPETNGPIQVKGKVVWKNKFTIDSVSAPRYDVGVQFIDIPQEYREIILKHAFVSPKRRAASPREF